MAPEPHNTELATGSSQECWYVFKLRDFLIPWQDLTLRCLILCIFYQLSDAAHYSHRPGAGDGFSATRTEAQGSHDKQSAPVATTPNQWQRCSEGFCLSESERNKSPVRKSQPKLNHKNPEQKVPTPKVVKNFGQRWIQSEELFDAVGSQKPWQKANDSLSKPASRSKASVSRSPKPTEGTYVLSEERSDGLQSGCL